MTDGIKFGGHFLAYTGDPEAVHAAFVVRVWCGEAGLAPEAVSAAARAAAGARKALLVAWPVRDWRDVTYTTIMAMDTQKVIP